MAFIFGGGGRKGSDRGDSQEAKTRFAAISEVRAYWEALREAGSVPRRDKVDPRGIAGALEQVFIGERIAPGMARFRLAGMQINDLMGMEVRGMPLSALFEPGARSQVADVLEAVFRHPSVAEMSLEGERGIGRPALEARLLLMPLKGARGESDLVLGCLALEGEIGRSPRRFAVARALHEPLSGGAPVRVMAPGFAEPNATFERRAVPRPLGGKPYLRLVKSDE